MAGLPCSWAPEGQGLCLSAVQPSPHDGLTAPAPSARVLPEGLGVPDFLREGMCKAGSSVRVCMGPREPPC